MSMRDNRRPYRNVVSRWTGLIILAIMAGWIVGCATGPRFEPSSTVSRQFESGQLLPGHRYYVGGPQSKPNAIVAIDAAYQLESDLWRPVEVTPETLERLVGRVGFVVRAEYQSALRPNGARLVTAAGTVVGAWYSAYEYSWVEMLEGNRIAISEPLAELPRNMPRPL